MNARAAGTFEVDLTPQPADAPPSITRMLINKRYSGGLTATGTGQMISFVSGVDGSAGYTALELVEGDLEGLVGTFVLQHSGIMDRGAPQLSLTVVPDSGTDALTGLRGEMSIEIDNGLHRYELAYSIG